MKIDDFYAECAALLGTTDECQPFPYYRRNRWNNRKPGRGRFEGYGIIRAFGNMVHIHLHHPKALSGVFENYDDALTYLRQNLT